MGNVSSRPVPPADDETLGLEQLFAVSIKASRYRLLPRFVRRWLIKLRLAAHNRVPARHRQRGIESIDSMGEMRCILSAMGGWEEAAGNRGAVGRGRTQQPKRQSTADSGRGPWAGFYVRH